ncbi:MAG: mercuric reductase [Verrucomicrobia bacterium]|nr:mercuric reductase [Verrucomicrobiota bacterium]
MITYPNHPPLIPWDEHNQKLQAHLHPTDWINPEPAARPACQSAGRYNLVVIGAGPAGLVVAAGAAGLGAKVALIERHLLGGDCLNYGCVPSKALIRSARAAADLRTTVDFGLRVNRDVEIDFAAVMERLRRLRAGLSHHDSAQRFRSLGIDVFLGSARFVSRDCVEVDGKRLPFAKAAIATGARATKPAIPGLAEAGYLTNETVFSLTERPQRLAVIGGGPIGCELAQAFHRLGCHVSLLHKNQHLLDREDGDAAAIVQGRFVREGIELILNCALQKVEKTADGKRLSYASAGHEAVLVVDEILVAAGRSPNIEGLNLETAGVQFDRHGVHVNDFLQTTNSRIYAAGDICLKHKFTHVADAAARIVIQNALFRGRKRASALVVPWCTYTDPEIAHVGFSEKEARARGISIQTYIHKFEAVDRAVLDGETEGMVRVHVRAGTDKILGATLVARHAGDMISEITLAIVGGLGLSAIGRTIHPYPTQAEAIRKVADAYNRSRLTPFLRKLLNGWLKWTR